MNASDARLSLRWLRSMVFLMLAIAAGCKPAAKPDEISGGAIVRHGAYMYRVGGKSASGAVSADIEMALITLAADGTAEPLQWKSAVPLPEGRAYACVVAAGNLLYVLGGEGAGGAISSTIFYTRIDPADGSLGFDAGTAWEQNSTPLPLGVSRAACEIYDGRIFLVGGESAQGLQDTILHARLYQDGGIGSWYASPRKLPTARSRAASAIHHDTLVVAGGRDSAGAALDEMLSYAIGSSGLLADASEARLPKALYSPVLLSDGDSLILAGGYDAARQGSASVYRFSGGSWADEQRPIDAEGPTACRAAGSLWYVKQPAAGGATAIAQDGGINLAPDRPIVVPGSGMVPRNSPVRAKPEPGTTLYYHSGAGASEDWEEEGSIGVLSAATDATFAAFSPSYPSASASQEVKRTYRICRSGSLVAGSAAMLEIVPAGTRPQTLYLRENAHDPAADPLTAIWCSLKVDPGQELELVFADASSSPGAYTSRIALSLLEADLCTEVLDAQGRGVLDYASGTAQPVRFMLQQGTYYISIKDSDGLAGGSFGIVFRKG